MSKNELESKKMVIDVLSDFIEGQIKRLDKRIYFLKKHDCDLTEIEIAREIDVLEKFIFLARNIDAMFKTRMDKQLVNFSFETTKLTEKLISKKI